MSTQHAPKLLPYQLEVLSALVKHHQAGKPFILLSPRWAGKSAMLKELNRLRAETK